MNLHVYLLNYSTPPLHFLSSSLFLTGISTKLKAIYSADKYLVYYIPQKLITLYVKMVKKAL